MDNFLKNNLINHYFNLFNLIFIMFFIRKNKKINQFIFNIKQFIIKNLNIIIIIVEF